MVEPIADVKYDIYRNLSAKQPNYLFHGQLQRISLFFEYSARTNGIDNEFECFFASAFYIAEIYFEESNLRYQPSVCSQSLISACKRKQNRTVHSLKCI